LIEFPGRSEGPAHLGSKGSPPQSGAGETADETLGSADAPARERPFELK